MYVLKTAALPDLVPNDEVEVIEYPYYGGDAIKAGDAAFLWFSGADQRLAWSAEVIQVHPAIDRKLIIRVRLIAQSTPNALTLADLASITGSALGSALSELSRKLYKHSHNKVAALSEEEAALLRLGFPA